MAASCSAATTCCASSAANISVAPARVPSSRRDCRTAQAVEESRQSSASCARRSSTFRCGRSIAGAQARGASPPERSYPQALQRAAQRTAGARSRGASGEMCASARRPTSCTSTPSRSPPTATCCGDRAGGGRAPQHRIAAHGAPRRSESQARWRATTCAPQARRLRRYERAVAGRFPLNIIVSEADAAQPCSASCPGVRTAVVPNGVDTDYFQPRASGEARRP